MTRPLLLDLFCGAGRIPSGSENDCYVRCSMPERTENNGMDAFEVLGRWDNEPEHAEALSTLRQRITELEGARTSVDELQDELHESPIENPPTEVTERWTLDMRESFEQNPATVGPAPCFVRSPDQTRCCILAVDHEGPHGWHKEPNP